MRRVLIGVMTLLWLSSPLTAVTQTTAHTHVQVNLDKSTVQAGQTVYAAVTLRYPDGWHSYWKNPGESGLPTQINWTLPDTIESGDILWPVPKRFVWSDFQSYGYETSVTLINTLHISDLAKAQKKTLKASINWLICDTVCIPEKVEVSIPLTIGPDTQKSPHHDVIHKQIKQAKIPMLTGTFTQENKTVTVKVSIPDQIQIQNPVFMSDMPDSIDMQKPLKFSQKNKTATLEIAVNDADTKRLSGVLKLNADTWVTLIAQKSILATWLGIISACLLAFLGGVLLNIMPCVFPILSLKVLGILSKSEEDQDRIKTQARAYTLGVLATFFAIALTLVGLKATGLQLGWGFQLQHPAVIMILLFLMLSVGLNLNEIFQLPSVLQALPSKFSKLQSAISQKHSDFWTGVLAVFVATPCTAPFMAAAIGIALTQSLIIILLVFLCLGLGFASPYYLIASVPVLQKCLPKPGAWMPTLKHLLAIPMYATALWLAWVLSNQIGSVAIVYAGFVTALWVGACLLKNAYPKMMLVALVAVIGLSIGVLNLSDRQTQTQIEKQNKQAFLELEKRLLTKKKTLVDVTASWCITCKVNEAMVLDTPEIKKALNAADIKLIKLDWTNHDADITAFIQKYQRQGVPFYVYYNQTAEPKILPQVLSKQLIINLFQEETNE